MSLPENIRGSAVFSECGKYRYRLDRDWSVLGSPLVRSCWVLLNPSKATAELNDQTVAKCIRLSNAWGCNAMTVVNIFALRSTDPRELYKADEPVGVGNDEAILAAVRHAAIVVAGWGNHGMLRGRGVQVRDMLIAAGVPMSCLASNAGGQPGHPLYLPSRTKPRPYPEDANATG
jgi:hypothetical protein